jgi:hypothetical protein
MTKSHNQVSEKGAFSEVTQAGKQKEPSLWPISVEAKQ